MSEPEHPPASGEDDRSWQPSWLILTPFLGRPPPLTRHQWRIIGLISVVNIFDQYDLMLFSLALKQIQADLAIPEAQLGEFGAIVRLGALPAFFFGVIADRIGRRRVLLITIVAYTLLTAATAFSPNAITFVVLQFLARTFAVAEVMLAFVVISEELGPEARGWGAGALMALGALGSGLALGLFALVDVLPMGWRSLYLIGLFPMVLVAWLRRSLPETGRFEQQKTTRNDRSALRGAVRPIIDLVRMYPLRFLMIASVVFLLGFTENAAGFFGPKYIQEVHGWQPWQYSLLGIAGGFIGIFGGTIAGRLSDRHGRRLVATIFLLAHPAFVLAFYSAWGVALAPLWIGMVFSGMAGGVVLATFGNEIFPTSHRSTASGARVIVATLGGVAGLWAESVLFGIFGSHWTAVQALVVGAFIAPILVLLFFPETSGRELEDISPEKTG
ncbi:MAG: MFS transporter [Deltaproteobacteria bacterium]|nr:MFS transporter [Deltaproteobacteria bacterium]